MKSFSAVVRRKDDFDLLSFFSIVWYQIDYSNANKITYMLNT